MKVNIINSISNNIELILNFLLPEISVGKAYCPEVGEKRRKTIFNFPTKLLILDSKNISRIKVSLLGFGLELQLRILSE